MWEAGVQLDGVADTIQKMGNMGEYSGLESA